MHTTYESVGLALPIEERRRAHDFYTQALGLEAFGPEQGGDGLPEPLMLRVNAGLALVLVPTRGFSWVIGAREVAASGLSECLLRIEQESEDAVRALVARAESAGAEVVTEPGAQPWGFEGTFADPEGHLWTVALAA